MMERMKSFLLVLLVAASLIQSYMLAYSTPNLELISQSSYVQPDFIGKQSQLDALLFPESIALHFGDETHAVVYPDTAAYEQVLHTIRGRSYEGMRRTNLSMDWNLIRSAYPGVELIFREPAPISVLQQVFTMKGDLFYEADTIQSIWIYQSEREIRTIFITDLGSVVYEAMNANLSAKDLEPILELADTLPPYLYTEMGFYLPVEPLDMHRHRIPYTAITAEQMRNSLFVDPSMARSLTERDGSTIYTDGKKGLQVKKDKLWMTYSDPIAATERRNELRENLLSAIQFINRHGGWEGKFLLTGYPSRSQITNQLGPQGFVFRQYYGSYPIVGGWSEPYGFIRIQLQKGLVASYERSLIVLSPDEVESSDMQLSGADVLEEQLSRLDGMSEVKSVYPAYRPIVGPAEVDLVPVWVVQYADGTIEYLQ